MSDKVKAAADEMLHIFRAMRWHIHSADLPDGLTLSEEAATVALLRAQGWFVTPAESWNRRAYIMTAPRLLPHEATAFECSRCHRVCGPDWGTDESDLCSVCATRAQLTDEQRAELNPRRLPEVWDSWTDAEGD